jgi:phage host-nuclease inhibitor protein Gam
MTKKGPLTKVEKFYILHNTGLESKTLASELNRTQKSVETYIKSNQPDTKSVSKTKSSENAITTTGSLMARNDRGAVTMTQAASQMSDDSRPKKQLPSSLKNDTTTIKKT